MNGLKIIHQVDCLRVVFVRGLTKLTFFDQVCLEVSIEHYVVK